MKIFKNFIFFLALTILFPQVLFSQSSIENIIPKDWKIVKTIIVPQDKVSLFSQKIGAEAETITNYLIEADNNNIQINIVNCKTKNDAEIIYKKFVDVYKTEEKCLITDKIVWEFKSSDNELILKAKSIFKDDSSNPIAASGNNLLKPNFGNITTNWSNQVFEMNMDKMWQSNGINARGQNYYLFPKPVQSLTYSDRFNPKSKYFQSWFGAYTVEDSENIIYALSNDSVNAKAIIRLAIADQIAWLQNFAGLHQPSVSIDSLSAFNVTRIVIDGTSGWKIIGWINSNADVGVSNPTKNIPPLITIPSSAWEEFIGSYANVKLQVVCYVWHKSKQLNIVYYNGIEYIDSKGATHKTLNQISEELESMASGVTINK